LAIRCRAGVEAAGVEAGEGFIKLPYDRPLPVGLIKRLLRNRLSGLAAFGSKRVVNVATVGRWDPGAAGTLDMSASESNAMLQNSA
jgi:hypothetical protein